MYEEGETDESVSYSGGRFSNRAFMIGMGITVVLYGALGIWLWRAAPHTFESQQGRLASVTAAIVWPPPPEKSQESYGPDLLDSVAEATEPDAAAPVVPDITELYEEAGASSPVANSSESQATPAPSDGGDLGPAPLEGLFETTKEGRLPIIRQSDKMTPFQAYRRPFDRQAVSTPIISLAVTDIGLSDTAGQSALRSMPPEVSFAISPYARTPDQWVRDGRAKGHESWMMLPMEADEYPRIDTGPYTLLITAPERQNQAKLATVLGSAAGYVGCIATANPAFMQAINDMRPVIGSIYSRGLAFIDTSAEPGITAQSMALGQHAPYASADIWLDETPTKEGVQAALAKLEERARSQGSAIGLIRPLPLSYQEILAWIKTLPEKGLTLAPLSAQTGF